MPFEKYDPKPMARLRKAIVLVETRQFLDLKQGYRLLRKLSLSVRFLGTSIKDIQINREGVCRSIEEISLKVIDVNV